MAHGVAQRVAGGGKEALRFVVRRLLPTLAPLVKIMAATGIGSDACLRHGCLPMPVHYYSPVLDVPSLDRRRVWDRRTPLAGIELNLRAQLGLLRRLGSRYGSECRWPEQRGADRFQFHTNNGNFSFGCAAALHSMIRLHRPHRVIEVGSGNSSLVISRALAANVREDPSCDCTYTILDPYPRRSLEGLSMLSELRAVEVQTVDPAFFQALEANDILFVDSSHVVRTGGDVNFVYLDVLPNLAPGVLVHFHDIPLPFEYPRIYATNPKFRVFWTEAYILQAFLAFNSAYEVLLTMALIQADYFHEFKAAFPHFSASTTSYQSGSFWIRRKPSRL